MKDSPGIQLRFQRRAGRAKHQQGTDSVKEGLINRNVGPQEDNRMDQAALDGGIRGDLTAGRHHQNIGRHALEHFIRQAGQPLGQRQRTL